MSIILKDDGSALIFKSHGGLQATKLVAKLQNDRGEVEEVEFDLNQVADLYGKNKLTEVGADVAAEKTKKIRDLEAKLNESANPEEIKRLNKQIEDTKTELEAAAHKAKQDAAETIKSLELRASNAEKERDQSIKRYRDSTLSALVSQASEGLVQGAAKDARALLLAEYGVEWEVPEGGGDPVPVSRIPVEEKNEATGKMVTVLKKMTIPDAVKQLASARPQWQPASNGGAGGAGGSRPYSPLPGKGSPEGMGPRDKLALAIQKAG